ncbi:MAG: SH3 domain-containing protein, partial [Eubacteriales bacterium]
MFLRNLLPRAEEVDLLKKFASFLIPFLASFLFLLCVSLGPAASFAYGDTAVVQTDTLNIRGGPGTDYGVTGQAGRDTRLAVLDKSGDWLKVQTDSGPGWIAGWLVAVEQPGSPAPPAGGQPAPGGNVAVVSGSYINVRSGPGTGYDVLVQAGRSE